MGDQTPYIAKKKPKKIAEARESGEKLDILNHSSMGGEISSGFGGEEVVLLDFSDKNIYEEMMRQEQKRKEEMKKREAANGGPAKGRQPFRPQQRRSLKRGGKRKKYMKEENTDVVTSVEIPENVRVYEFAEKVNRKVGEVVGVLFALGMMVTKNDFLSKDEIEILAEEFEVEVSTVNPLDELDYADAYEEVEVKEGDLQERPPVITIMGHVDHGKTSLLDRIRTSKVADKEAGGITQHVGAYQVEKNGKKITFVDTPGHEAFTEMRARGAQATDIVIIVVAADDGVMPQTKEAISHTKAAGVPMIIAVNKMDKESANPDNVKSQLAEIDVMATDWGGEYEFVPVSAHSGLGIDDLLETILLQAELMELGADASRDAKAVVVEASLEKGFGPVANVIIQNGTLHVGDNVIVGKTYGRIKAIKLDDGSAVKEIGPSTPAAIVGLNEVPGAGEALVVMDTDREVRELAEKRAEYDRAKVLSKSTKATLDDLSALIAEKLWDAHEVDLRWGYDRKEEKRYGDPADQDIVGDLRDGDSVLIVDDVIVTGKTKIDNWDKLTGYRSDLSLKGILIAVDRQEIDEDGNSTTEILRDAGMVVYPVLRITEIFDYLLDRTVDGTVYVDGRIKAAFDEYFEEYGTRV